MSEASSLVPALDPASNALLEFIREQACAQQARAWRRHEQQVAGAAPNDMPVPPAVPTPEQILAQAQRIGLRVLADAALHDHHLSDRGVNPSARPPCHPCLGQQGPLVESAYAADPGYIIGG